MTIMTPTIRKIAADVILIGSVVAGVLAVIVNVAHGVDIPAPYVTWIVSASGIIGAIVNTLRPFAAATVVKVMKSLKIR